MGTAEQALLDAFEVHSVDEVHDALDRGLDIQGVIRGRTVVNWLIAMYTRSDQFADCLRVLLERGATMYDPRVAPVLLNDPDALNQALDHDPSLLQYRTNLESAFTPLTGATLLHVAAEFGHVAVAQVLLERGAEVDARAAVDAFGMNGHTPLFHTVNAHANRPAPVMELLLEAGARPDIRLEGITWGQGFEWETTCFDVTPISYAQLGLLPQMHRLESNTYDNVRRLLEASGRRVPPLDNVPNQYLKPSGES